jgi:hypothetical protein
VGALNRLTVVAALAALAVAAVIAGLLLAGGNAGQPGVTPSARLAVHTSFEPETIAFGDRIVARAVVLLDRDRVRVGTLQVSNDLAPLTLLGPAQTTRTNRGRLQVVSVSVPVACLTDPCVKRSGDTPLVLPRLRAAVEAKDGHVLHARTKWPELHVGSRVTAADLKPVRPPFRGDATPPPVTYSLSPSTLGRLLDLAAALFAAAGLGLAVFEGVLFARRPRRAPVSIGDLEAALRYVRESEERPAPDRRRALSLVARVLDRRHASLAGEARELAWSEPKPDPRELSELVSEIEREVGR